MANSTLRPLTWYRSRITEALQRPAQELGVLPEFALLRPQLDIRVYGSLTSTNQEAWRLIDQGDGAGTVVIAQQQSAGRGQWGRQWSSPAGGLYLSLVLEPDIPSAEATLLTLASAWGIAICFENLGIDLQLKWPNDLVSYNRKVGGILTETRIGTWPHMMAAAPEYSVQYAVVGVGVNWDNPLLNNALSLRQLLPDQAMNRVKNLADLSVIVLRGILQGYYYYQRQGRASFIQAYQQKLLYLGKNVVFNGYPAIVKGVSDSGDLTLELYKNGQKSVQSLKPGEISLGYNG